MLNIIKYDEIGPLRSYSFWLCWSFSGKREYNFMIWNESSVDEPFISMNTIAMQFHCSLAIEVGWNVNRLVFIHISWFLYTVGMYL